MALDTRNKRGSALGLLAGLALVLPTPDALSLDQGDRQQVTFCYRGLLAGPPPPASLVPCILWQDGAITRAHLIGDSGTAAGCLDEIVTYAHCVDEEIC